MAHIAILPRSPKLLGEPFVPSLIMINRYFQG